MRQKFETAAQPDQEDHANEDEEVVTATVDSFKQAEEQAVQAVLNDPHFENAISSEKGIKWARVIHMIKDKLPAWIVADRDQTAFRLIFKVLDAVGPENEVWETYRENGNGPKYVRLLRDVAFKENG